jgi:hypothetical protein
VVQVIRGPKPERITSDFLLGGFHAGFRFSIFSDWALGEQTPWVCYSPRACTWPHGLASPDAGTPVNLAC